MNPVIPYFLKTVIGFALFYPFYKMVFERGNQFGFNRFYLLSTSFLALLFPLIKIQIPAAIFPMNKLAGTLIIQLNAVSVHYKISVGGVSDAYSWLGLIQLIYFSGMAITAVIFIIKLSSLFHLIRKYKAEHSGKYAYYYSESENLSFSIFHYIFIGRHVGLSEEDNRRILEHELAHAKQKHTFDLIYFEILTVLFWFNPFIWFYKKNLADTHEYLADEAVINKTGNEGYGQLLVKQVVGYDELWPSANFFLKSKTLKRIEKMKAYGKKSNHIILPLFFPAVIFVFFLISCTGKNATFKESTPADSGSVTATQPPSGTKNEELSEAKIPFDTVANKVYKVIDEQPVPPGGIHEFFSFLANNLKYPELAKKAGIQGTVYVKFIVDKDGNVRNVGVLKGIAPDLDNEAVRVVSLSKSWKPGKNAGEAVAVQYYLPVKFVLDSKN